MTQKCNAASISCESEPIRYEIFLDVGNFISTTSYQFKLCQYLPGYFIHETYEKTLVLKDACVNLGMQQPSGLD